MEQLDLIRSLGGTCLGLILTVITFFLKGHSNAINKKRAQNLLKITSILLPWIEEAEKFVNYSGTEKKEYVLTKASRYALENKIEFNEEIIIEKIEELIDFSKQVNSKELKKVEEIKPTLSSWLER